VTGIADLQGGRVKFPATQVASADANTLDDYEESDSWVPVVTSDGGSLTSYTSSGAYTKIGRMVVARFEVTITNAGTGTGALRVVMPFTPNANYNGSGREEAITGVMLMVYTPSVNAVVLRYDNASPIATGHVIRCTVTFFV
jgi:hypothetical protein